MNPSLICTHSWRAYLLRRPDGCGAMVGRVKVFVGFSSPCRKQTSLDCYQNSCCQPDELNRNPSALLLIFAEADRFRLFSLCLLYISLWKIPDYVTTNIAFRIYSCLPKYTYVYDGVSRRKVFDIEVKSNAFRQGSRIKFNYAPSTFTPYIFRKKAFKTWSHLVLEKTQPYISQTKTHFKT